MREQTITPDLTKAIEKYHKLAIGLSDDLYAPPEAAAPGVPLQPEDHGRPPAGRL